MTQPDYDQRLEEIIQQINESEVPSEELLLALKEFRPMDIAEDFIHIRRNLQATVFNSFDDQRAAEVLVELDDVNAIEILKDLKPERIASILNYLPPDEGADVYSMSEEEDQSKILNHVEDDLADQIRDLATYAPESAGGLMTSNFLAVSGDENVRSVLLKVKTSDQVETINNIYVTDKKERLVGVASVRDLLEADLNQTISSISEKDIISVPLEMDQEEVSRIANKYHFHSLPVVDRGGVLKGIITFDDIMEVMEEESSEDMYRMAGEVTLHPTQQPVIRRIAARFPWLMVTLGGTFLAAAIIKGFESVFSPETALNEIENVWTFLLCFLPMIGAMAGNVGLQSSTVMVRGLATGEVEPPFLLNLLAKEILISAIIGVLSAIIIGSLIFMIYRSYEHVGFVVGLSLFSAILSAAFLGTMTPFFCLILKVDPAYASGPLLTTLNDIIGFLIFFGIAYALL